MQEHRHGLDKYMYILTTDIRWSNIPYCKTSSLSFVSMVHQWWCLEKKFANGSKAKQERFQRRKLYY